MIKFLKNRPASKKPGKMDNMKEGFQKEVMQMWLCRRMMQIPMVGMQKEDADPHGRQEGQAKKCWR